VASELSASFALTPADVAGGLALSTASGWNQTADDWQLFITHGHVVGVRDDDGEIVATAAALPYGGGAGWISMVLVTPAWRNRGLATRLMNDCVKHLQSRSITPVLDATPAGSMVYRRMGFVPGFELERWENGAVDVAPAPSSACRVASSNDLAQIEKLDAAANGLDRRLLLQSLLSREDTRAWLSHDEQGFVILRRGLRALQVGPLVAADEQAAIALSQAAMSVAQGPVFLDVPRRWAAIGEWLSAHGFRHQRPFVRMALGPAQITQVNDRLFVIAGPEFG